MLEEMNVCFDRDKYENTVRNESQRKAMSRQLERDNKDCDSDDNDYW